MNALTPLSVSIPEAAKLTGVGRSSIYLAIKAGALPIRKIGRRTVIETGALQNWLASMPTKANVAA